MRSAGGTIEAIFGRNGLDKIQNRLPRDGIMPAWKGALFHSSILSIPVEHQIFESSPPQNTIFVGQYTVAVVYASLILTYWPLHPGDQIVPTITQIQIALREWDRNVIFSECLP